MTKRIVLLVLIASLCCAVASAQAGNRKQTLEAVALVADPFEMADILEDWVDSSGGYLVSRLEEEVILRVPSDMLDEFVSMLETEADEIIQIQQRTEDISQPLLEAQAGIRSKTELFNRALTLIDETDLATTLEIEREILSILRDIERLEGTFRKLTGEIDLALVEVAFTLEEEKLPENLPSAFAWINRVDFYLLMAEFGQ